jgi:drug/metabolite transporter (DMT)-like permease
MTTQNIRRMGLIEWLMLLTLSIIWGGSFFFNAVALRGLPPLLVVFGRVFIGCLGLVTIIALTRQEFRSHLHRWPRFLVLGTLNTALPFSLIVWGQQYIDSGLAAVINAITPAFTILVANFFTTDERASVRKFSGAIIGLSGVAVLIGTDALAGIGDHVLGQLAVMGATFSYACAATYARRLAGIPPLVVSCGQLAASSLVMLPVALVFTRPWELDMPGLDALGAVVGLGLICSALAYLLFFRLLNTSGATNVSLVTLLIPFSASGLGIAFLGESFTLRLLAGMLIVSTAALLIDGRIRFGRNRP